MASTYNSLGYQLMQTGENAGTWGDKTNTTLNEIKQTFGYISLDMAAADRTLTIPDGDVGTNDGRAFIIEMTGTLAGTRVLDIAAQAGDPAANINKPFIVFDNTTHSGQTLTFKVTGQTGFALTEGTTYLCYHNGTDIINTNLGALTLPAGSTTEIQYNNSGAFGGDANLYWDSTGLNIGTSKELRLQDDAGGSYIGQKAANSTANYTLTWPAATGAVDEVLSTNGSGILSWVAMAGGTSWAAVVTGATKTAVAGEGYFIDTTLNACNLTLPGGVLGDEVSVVDYAGTFDTNNLTVTPDTGEKIQGNTADATLTVATERAGFTLAYSGSAQGWLLKNN